jgi:alkaline phosphatase D
MTGSACATGATHGVAVGDVDSDSALIWSRSDRDAIMHVELLGPRRGWKRFTTVVESEHDYTGKIHVDRLKPNTQYHYRVWFTNSDKAHKHEPMEKRYDKGAARKSVTYGSFRTAPNPDTKSPLRFAWGGDLAGQNTCRDASEGFPIFAAINSEPLDFFIGLGDMIYADGVCESKGRYGNAQIPGNFIQSADMENYWAHWKYNREDDGYRELLANLPYYAIWDDHEVVNDFGPLHDSRDTAPYTAGKHLLPLGLAAFLDYNPIAEHPATPKRLYRHVRWGKHLEMFILDTRQYRDANFETDSIDKRKTMLGREQLTWLKQRLKESDATWKVIVSSVPLSIPTGSALEAGRDGWADYTESGGFEHELIDILRTMQQLQMKNLIFITTDVHFAEAFRYTPFVEAPDFQLHELVTGPINAGLFPNRAFDETLGSESLFFFGADSSHAVTTWEEAKSWFNYGIIEIDESGQLNASIRDVYGTPVYSLSLAPRQ